MTILPWPEVPATALQHIPAGTILATLSPGQSMTIGVYNLVEGGSAAGGIVTAFPL